MLNKMVSCGIILALSLGFFSCEKGDVEELPAPELRTENQLLSFHFLLSENPIEINVIGDIDEENHSVFAVLPGDALKNALVADISVSPGASFEPAGVINFNVPVNFTITAEDGTAVQYEVKVVTEKEGLIAIENANPGNSLGWNVFEPDLSVWEGVTLTNGAISNLNLSNSGITVLPSEIGYFHNLIDLSLQFNDFPTIPKEIEQLRSLTRLGAGLNDALTSVPPEIGNLESLKRLHLHNNPLLTSIPREIGNLSTLTDLYINGNGFSIIPKEVCDMESKFGTFIWTGGDATCEE